MARNKNYEALISAVKNDDLKGVQRLLNKGIDPNSVGDNQGSPLHFVQSAAMVDLLCSKGANPNLEVQTIPTIGGRYAPIHTAANGEVVHALVKRGANVTMLCRHNNQSAMHTADKPDIVDALVECGGAELLNQRDADGKTPSDYAGYGLSQHDISVLRCLQKHGAKNSADLDRELTKRVAEKKAAAGNKEHGKDGFGR